MTLDRLRRSLLIVVVCLALTVALAGQAPPATQTAPPDIDAWVARAMKTFDVPGTGVAVVKDGKVVLAKG